ncbi:unnamed protein product, partial [Coregonus sp. 'balchen']
MSESPDTRSLVSASSQLNLMEIDTIDDKEFDIPQVDTPPTLESILNEPEDEDEPFILEDTKRKTVELNATVHGSVLRHSILKGISAQIVSAADKVDAGLPTAVTVSGVIVVGTSHGLALVFDLNQALRLCLGSTTTGAEYGAVSALSINHDCTRLLCGFAKGQITMWDLANGKLLRTITDAHPPGTAILHVKFTDDPTLAVCNDSGGSILVIGLKPSLKVWMTFPYGKFVPVQKVLNPILAFCRGDTIHFLLVKKDETGTIHVIKQRQLQLNCDIISLSLRVVDRPSQEELETLDMAERVDCLLKQERFVEALSLAWSFHEGTAKAVLGLFGDPAKRKGVVADKMLEILFQYVERSVKKCPEHGKIQVMEQHFQDMVPVVVDYCLLLQRTDLLFNQLYTRLVENCVARGVFLESLEPYIVSERLGCVTAPVMRDLLTHLQDNNMMDSVENCLIHLDITSLDIQQVVQMCWDNQLYDAMIYVFNSGMNDYINPMEKLFQVISPPLREGKALTGRAYPLGDIPEDLVSQVKNQVMVENSDFTPSQVGCAVGAVAGGGWLVQFDEGRLLGLAEKAEFYQICEFLYEQKHLYDKIMDCYLRDPLRKEEIFNYIHNLLSLPGYSTEEKQCVWDKALLHIAELVTLDPAKSADLVAMHFPEEVRPIITKLH